jgi:ELWxxDGT repeat protein
LVGDKFYFIVKADIRLSSNDLLQVWISDGTAAGTKIVIEDLPIWNSVSFQGKCNNTFIFTFQTPGTNDSRVWRCDGTKIGTFPITEDIDGNGAGPGGTSALSQYIEFNNELYFVSRYYLHKTDGTLENTEIVSDLSYTSNLVTYADVIATDSNIYFSFFISDIYSPETNQLSIYASDGTKLGTTKIYDESSANYFMPSNLLSHENHIIFSGSNHSGGTSLIKLNVADNSTTQIKTIQEFRIRPFFFRTESDLCHLQNIDNNLIFCSSPSDNYTSKGWTSGLTEESTINIEILNNVYNRRLLNFKNSTYFSNKTDLQGYELWKTDGSEVNTFLIDNINKSKNGLKNQTLNVLNSNLIFTADNGTTGNELWKYNGSSTTLVKDINVGSGTSYIQSITNSENELFFNSYDGIHGRSLWKSDGSEWGTKLVHETFEGTAPYILTTHNGVLYFIARKNGQSLLCSSDGITINVIKDLGNNISRVTEMVSSGNYIYFSLETYENSELWMSDGTETGTTVIKDLSSCNTLTDIDDVLFFVGSETNERIELWTTGGTESTTKQVKNIGFEHSSIPKNLINFNGTIFFTAFTNENGRELWKSNGSENGTILVKDINLGSQSSIDNGNLCIMDNTLYFSANNGENGYELWKSDGTELGTSIVKDINIGPEGSFPTELKSIDNSLYFQAYDTEHGSELWKSDGTESGTLLVYDIIPGIVSSTPTNITSINSDIFFIAESIDNGRQIWKSPNNLLGSLTKEFDKDQISVFPNPFTNFIHLNTKLKPENFSIHTINGKSIDVKISKNNNIDVSELAPGLYILKFNIVGKTYHKKMLKHK